MMKIRVILIKTLLLMRHRIKKTAFIPNLITKIITKPYTVIIQIMKSLLIRIQVITMHW